MTDHLLANSELEHFYPDVNKRSDAVTNSIGAFCMLPQMYDFGPITDHLLANSELEHFYPNVNKRSDAATNSIGAYCMLLQRLEFETTQLIIY